VEDAERDLVERDLRAAGGLALVVGAAAVPQTLLADMVARGAGRQVGSAFVAMGSLRRPSGIARRAPATRRCIPTS